MESYQNLPKADFSRFWYLSTPHVIESVYAQGWLCAHGQPYG